jgi:SH3-like domain-containing protein
MNTKTKLPNFSPLLKPLFITFLILLFILSSLCIVVRMLVNTRISDMVLEQADKLINVATPPAEVPPGLQDTVVPSIPPASETPLLGPTWPAQESVAETISTPLPVPSATPTPTPTVTPTPVPISGIVVNTGSRLNVREGPNIGTRIVTRLNDGDPITILQRTPAGDWLEIETSDGQRGWVLASYIETAGDIQAIKVAAAAELASAGAATSLLALNIEGRSVSGQLGPRQEQWYTFSDDDEETLIVFMFTPNINFKPNIIQFFLYGPDQIPAWPPRNPDALTNVGASSYPASDRDGDDKTGELIWRGGPLLPGARYYLRFINRSDASIHYCLAPKDEYRWSCP